jgi:hypothetical protein
VGRRDDDAGNSSRHPIAKSTHDTLSTSNVIKKYLTHPSSEFGAATHAVTADRITPGTASIALAMMFSMTPLLEGRAMLVGSSTYA